MDKKQRNLIITVVVLVVVIVGAYVVYQSVLSKSSATAPAYVPTLSAAAVSEQPASSQDAVPAQPSGSETIQVAPDEPKSADSASADVVSQETAEEEAEPPVAVSPADADQETGDGTAEAQASPMVPSLPITALDGTATSLDQVRAGRPAVLNFWASWCPPCKKEMPDFQSVWEEMGDEVAFILLATADGRNDTVENVTKYIVSAGITAPVYYDDGSYAYIFGINSFPTTVFINPDGTLSHGYIGMISKEVLSSELRKMLGK